MKITQMDMYEAYDTYQKMAPGYTVNINGHKVTYRYYDNPDPEVDVTIVVLAGGTGLADGFYPLALSLAEKMSFVNVTYPLSCKDNDSTADTLVSLLEEIGARHVYLLGQSFGGLIAQVMAVRHPDVIEGLILSSTASFSTDLDYPGMAYVVGMVSEKKERKNRIIDHLIPKKLMVKAMKLVFRKHIEDKATAGKVGDMLEILKDEMTSRSLEHMDVLMGDLRHHFGRYTKDDFAFLGKRVLILSPGDDKIFPKNVREALIKVYPEATVHSDLKGGHLALLTRSDEVLGIITDFLQEVSG